MKIKMWPGVVLAILVSFMAINLVMVWIAVHNPPQMIERPNEWR